MDPHIERLSEVYQDRVAVWKVNADDQTEVVRALHVYGIPTLVVFDQGREVGRRVGAQSQPALEAMFAAASLSHAIPVASPGFKERGLRVTAGLALLAIAWAAGPSWILALIAGGVLFSAVYDRCPIWRAVWARVRAE
jgi:thioredoxin 1